MVRLSAAVVARSALTYLSEQGRLPDPRLPDDDERPTPAASSLFEKSRHAPKLVLPPDQHPRNTR